MSSSEGPRQAARGNRWSASEKRRIVELTLREGASVSEVALAHGIHHTSLSHWRSLHRAGKLTGRGNRACASGASEKFLPVTITAEQEQNVQSPRATAPSTRSTQMHERSIVYLSLPSGAAVRFETGALDFAFIRALLAELRT